MPRIITRVIDQDDFYGVPGSGQVVIYDNVGNGILGFKTGAVTSGAVTSGTVTNVSGTGTVSGLTLTGTVTSSGSLTLGGTLSAISLATGVSGILPVLNGGTGVSDSTGSGKTVLSISPTLVTPLSNALSAVPVASGAGNALTISAGSGVTSGAGANLILNPGEQATTGGRGSVLIDGLTVGKSKSSGTGNTVFGAGALAAITTGYENTATGQQALANNTTGSSNTANGTYALYSNTTGARNTANGYLSLVYNTTGSSNAANGFEALRYNTTGYENTATGQQALGNNTTGVKNTAVGNIAGFSLTTGSNNTFLGNAAGFNASQLVSAQNSMALGYGAFTTASNQVVIGNTSVTQIILNGTATTNALAAMPVTSGAGNALTISAGSGVTSGAGGSLILQAGLQAATGGDGKVIVKQVSGQTSSLQEWQNSAGTVLSGFDSAGRLRINSATNTGAAANNSQIWVRGGTNRNFNVFDTGGIMYVSSLLDDGSDYGTMTVKAKILTLAGETSIVALGNFQYGIVAYNPIGGHGIAVNAGTYAGNGAAVAIGPNASAGVGWITAQNNAGYTPIYIDASDLRFNENGGNPNGTVSIGGAPIANTRLTVYSRLAYVAGQIIKGAASQTANLQEWQNSAGTVLGAVSAAGNVNIGTTAGFGAKLHVKGNDTTAYNATTWQGNINSILVEVPNGAATFAHINFGSSVNLENSFGAKMNALGNGDFFWKTAHAGAYNERMVLTSAGSVGIGTTSPAASLQIDTGAASNKNSLIINQSDTTYFAQDLSTAGWGLRIRPIGTPTATNYMLAIGTGTGVSSGNLFAVQYNGNVGIGTASPAYALDIKNGGAFIVDSVGTSGKLNLYSTFHFIQGANSQGLILSSYDGVNDPISFRFNNVEKARVHNSGSIQTTGSIITNTVVSVPVTTGAGNSLTLTAGSGIGTGSGANLILNPGEFATSGTRGTVLIDGLTVGKSKSSGTLNTVVGAGALAAITTGYNNDVFGNGALALITTGNQNTAIGVNALGRATLNSYDNVAVGGYALYANARFEYNVAVGLSALGGVTGNNNIGIGGHAGENSGSVAESVFIGFIAGRNTTGSNNTIVGSRSGFTTTYLTSGTNNTLLGSFIDMGAGNETATNSIIIGKSAVGKGSNTTVIGNTSTTATWLYGTVTTNALAAQPVTSGAGNSLTIAAGSGVTSGAGGSLILQAGLQATSGGDGKVIVKQVAGQTSNLQEWQNSAGTVLGAVTAAGEVGIGTASPGADLELKSSVANRPSLLITNSNGDYVDIRSFQRVNGGGALFGQPRDGLQWLMFNTNGIAVVGTVNAKDMILGANNAEVMRIKSDGNVGIGTTSPSARTHIVTAAATKGLIVQGAASQSANLQEWQNNAGTVVSSVNAAGNFSGSAASLTNFPTLNQNTTGTASNVTGVVAVANGGTNLTAIGTANQVLAVNSAGTALAYTTISSGSGTVTSVSGTGTVSGLTLTGTVTSSGSLTLGGTLSAISLTTGVSGTLPVANGGTGVTTSTGTTNVVLSNSPTLVTPFANALSAVPVGSGAGNALTISAGSGVTSGAGANLILNPGEQATTGGRGNVLIDGLTVGKGKGSGAGNTAVGASALGAITTGTDTVAIGRSAMSLVQTMSESVAIGSDALGRATGGVGNIAIGTGALYAEGAGFSHNIGIGWAAFFTSTGSNNVGIGRQAGRSVTTGSNNTFLGYDAGHSGQLGTASNSMALGNGAFTTASNQVVIGNTSVTQTLLNGNVGIGTTSPQIYGAFAVRRGVTIGGVSVSLSSSDAALSTFDIRHKTGLVDLSAQESMLTFSTGTGQLERVRIDTTGNVGIGTASPGAKLEVMGGIKGQVLEAAAGYHGSNYLLTLYGTEPGGHVGEFRIWHDQGRIHLGASTNGTFNNDNGFSLTSASAAFSIPVVSLDFKSPAHSSLTFTQTGNPQDITFITQNSSERLRIKGDTGNVGIGTASPIALLNVNGRAMLGSATASHQAVGGITLVGSNGGLDISGAETHNNEALTIQQAGNAGVNIITSTTGTAYILFGDTVNKFPGGLYYRNNTDSMEFWANAAQRVTINSSGNVLIGNTTAVSGAKLEVTGSISATTTVISNALAAMPVTSGAGNALTIAAGSGIGTGSGANLILNPGEFATSGTRGTVLIDGLTVGKGKGSGAGNTAVGASALGAITTGVSNTIVGNSSSFQLATGARNTAIGADTIYNNLAGSENAIVGYGAAYRCTASFNTVVGSFAANLINSGTYNVVAGHLAGNVGEGPTDGSLVSGVGNILIGASVSLGTNNSAATNSIVIGRSAIGKGSNTTVIGTTSTTATWLYGTVTSNALAAQPVASGAGNSLTLSAGSGVGTGAGGNIILQAGLQATSGGDGKIQFNVGSLTVGSIETFSTTGGKITLGDSYFTKVNGQNFTFNSGGLFNGVVSFTSSITGGNGTADGPSYLVDADGKGHYFYSTTGTSTLIGAFAKNGLIIIGGKTSSFPGLKRSGTQIQVRLADDSADASLRASDIATNALAAIPVTSGAGNALTIAAGSGIGTGSGANLVLNPGEFATSGTRGSVLIDGLNAGKGKGSAVDNTVFGVGALAAVTTGAQNVAIGTNAMALATTTVQNASVGYNALARNTGGGANVAIGNYACYGSGTFLYNIGIGESALFGATGNNNIGIGGHAGENGGAVSGSIFIGMVAGRNTTGNDNVVIGYSAGFNYAGTSLTSGASNTLVGASTNMGSGNSAATNSIVIGANAIGKGTNTTVIGNTSTTATWLYGTATTNALSAMPVASGAGNSLTIAAGSGVTSGAGANLILNPGEQATTGGRGSVLIDGLNAGKSKSSGTNNTVFGAGALAAITTGFDSVAIGFEALSVNTTPTNTAVGCQALRLNTTGYSNTAVGLVALRNNITGNRNSAFGEQSLDACTGSENTGLGYYTLRTLTSGGGNTVIGSMAGADPYVDGLTTGNNNILVGMRATTGPGNNSVVNSIVIGALAVGKGTNTTVIGTTSTTATWLYGTVTSNALAAMPVTVTSAGNALAVSAGNALTTGAGGNLTLTAGSGAGVGAGGNIILQPGAQGSSGGNGTTIIKGQFISLGDFGSTTRIYLGATNAGTSITTGGGNASATLLDQYNNPAFQWGAGTVVISNSGAIRFNATTVFQFNGISSSFPALKQVGTQLRVRLADDSADASLSASSVNSNALAAMPVASGAGNSLTLTAGNGVGTGAGGSLILQAGIQATSGGDGKVIVKQVAGQTSNIFEVQNSGGTSLISVSASSPSIITISDGGGAAILVGQNQISFNQGNGSPVYFHNGNAAGQASTDVRSGNFLCGGYNATAVPIIVRSHASQTANLQEWRNSAGTALAFMDASGNFNAITKSFNIPHPTKEGGRLRYASLEGPENSVYIRGTIKGENEVIIYLPEYWPTLVHEDSLTVQTTAVGFAQPTLFVKEKYSSHIVLSADGPISADYMICAERRDVLKLEVES